MVAQLESPVNLLAKFSSFRKLLANNKNLGEVDNLLVYSADFCSLHMLLLFSECSAWYKRCRYLVEIGVTKLPQNSKKNTMV